ncbi:MAG: serine protein kinase RIO [Halobacteriota archaeon]
MIDKKLERIDKEVDKLKIRIKDANEFKVRDEVFDVPTLKALYYLASRNIIGALGGVISTGKEANVFHALGPSQAELAVKIYRIQTSDFKAMQDYITGDPRFQNIRRTKKDIVFAWTKKEYRNLIRACKAKVRVPEPKGYERNILVMEFMGHGGVPFPLLKGAVNEIEDIEAVYNVTIKYIKRLYTDADLVHADLSEYNILYDRQNGPIFIDMGQSVTLNHPNAEEFLQRDLRNIIKFFSENGVYASFEKTLKEIKDDREHKGPVR